MIIRLGLNKYGFEFGTFAWFDVADRYSIEVSGVDEIPRDNLISELFFSANKYYNFKHGKKNISKVKFDKFYYKLKKQHLHFEMKKASRSYLLDLISEMNKSQFFGKPLTEYNDTEKKK